MVGGGLVIVVGKRGYYFVAVAESNGKVLCKSKDFGGVDVFANKAGRVKYDVETLPPLILKKLGYSGGTYRTVKEVFSKLVFACKTPPDRTPPDKIMLKLARTIARGGFEIKEVEENDEGLVVYLNSALKYRIYWKNGRWKIVAEKSGPQQSNSSCCKDTKPGNADIEQNNHGDEQGR